MVDVKLDVMVIELVVKLDVKLDTNHIFITYSITNQTKLLTARSRRIKFASAISAYCGPDPDILSAIRTSHMSVRSNGIGVVG